MSDYKPNFLRPRNLTSPSAQGFWQGVSRGELQAQKCGDCGQVFFPPRLCCPECLGVDLAWVTLSGRGTIHSWTEVHFAGPEFDTPFILALIDLEEGVGRIMSRLTGAAAAEVAIGQRVRMEFTLQSEGVPMYGATLLPD